MPFLLAPPLLSKRIETLSQTSKTSALAALAAVSAASAQSTVTLYGNIEGSVVSYNNANAAKQNVVNYGDGVLSSSVWGLKGSEDLGGGLSAVFKAEGDLLSNAGGTNQNGIWRRGANAGLSSTTLGSLVFGLNNNPIISTNGALMPLGGNSLSTTVATSMAFSDFYTKNAVTYTTPNIAGLVGVLQRGMSNNVNSFSEGSVTAYSLAYVNGPLELRAAGQDRQAATATILSAANSKLSGTSELVTATDVNKRSYVLGGKYTMGALGLGLAYLESEKAADNGINTARTIKQTAVQVGAAYQLTPVVILGASYTKSQGSSLTNLQARYSLSKRTTVFGYFGMADNAASTAANATNFAPVSMNTGVEPSTIVTGAGATQGIKQNALAFGVAHSF